MEDIAAAVRVCHAHRAPITHRGGGTSLAGQACNTAVIIDSSKLCTRLLRLDPQRRRALVEPGLVLDDLRDAVKRYGLTFAPDPSTHDHNTLGGMLGNNSAGVHSVMGGKTVENVASMDVLTYDGLELTVGATGEEELASIIAEGGRRADIYRRLRDLRDRYATKSARGIRTSRVGSPGTTSISCCRSTASMSPARWSAAKAPVSPS